MVSPGVTADRPLERRPAAGGQVVGAAADVAASSIVRIRLQVGHQTGGVRRRVRPLAGAHRLGKGAAGGAGAAAEATEAHLKQRQQVGVAGDHAARRVGGGAFRSLCSCRWQIRTRGGIVGLHLRKRKKLQILLNNTKVTTSKGNKKKKKLAAFIKKT